MWDKENLYLSGNGWLVVSLFLLQITGKDTVRNEDQQRSACRGAKAHISLSINGLNQKRQIRWVRANVCPHLLSHLLSQRKAPWIKGLRGKCEGMRAKMKKTSMGENCKSWIQMDWNDMTVTSVRYKLVLFPKEGKPCGRNYIELTLFLAQLP